MAVKSPKIQPPEALSGGSVAEMDIQSLGFRTDLAVARLGSTQVEDRGDHVVVRTPDNPSFWWGNFLLVPSPGDMDRWQRRFKAEFPGASHLAIGVDGTDGRPGDIGDLEADISIVLTASTLTRPAADQPVEVRRVDSDDEWAQVEAVRASIDDQPDTAANREFAGRQASAARALCAAGHGAWFGAVVDGVIRSTLGIVAAGDGLARYRNVETHPGFRRRGLARALLVAAGQYAHDQLAAGTLVIVADPDYHAIALYRSLGFTDTEQQVQLTAPTG
jgi:ribosomal protein S18 acetylase RimI-like enzyme